MNEAVGRKGGGSGEEENVPEKEDSMCKGLGAGMSLPRTETLEHRPALPAPHLPATQVADQVKKKSLTGYSGPCTLGVSISGTSMSGDVLGPFQGTFHGCLWPLCLLDPPKESRQ